MRPASDREKDQEEDVALLRECLNNALGVVVCVQESLQPIAFEIALRYLTLRYLIRMAVEEEDRERDRAEQAIQKEGGAHELVSRRV